ncbi:MAG: hypothetical protein K0S38_1093 [Candidatus Paceibacter sp.]|jgi:hypothetical protein|nr:hypothetical protein [Candidatus Paceibacter sp.]
MFDEHPLDNPTVEEPRNLSEDIRVYGHTYLKVRLIVYLAIAAMMLGLVVYDIIQGSAGAIASSLSIIVGIGIGFVVSRMHHISWDKSAEKVVAQFDAAGIVILILYIVLELNRERLVEYFTHSNSPLAISFAVFAGIMIGRLLGIRRRVQKVISENL